MWETGRSQVAAETRYNLAVFRTSKTHRSQAGLMRLASEEVLSCAGHEENNASHTQVVSLMLYEEARNELIGLKSHEYMIIKTERITINLIQCYVPTNDNNEDDKDQLCERLQSVIEKCPGKELTILMEDLDARVGMDNNGYEDIMGRQGLGGRN
ncbi:unnamed protein product [Schistosoma margrebowiei]|uniref:Uncharacterized protein n=1 Tax=Schistosoma margrebowiei TaxID=48269 RepID=A0A183MF43_9TREM|nr:unnamed protein product [Schistosoma margrebowiei]